MLDPLNLPKLTPKSKIFGDPEKGDFFLLSYFVGFSNKLSRAKAVPLHRISKRAEIVPSPPHPSPHLRHPPPPFRPSPLLRHPPLPHPALRLISAILLPHSAHSRSPHRPSSRINYQMKIKNTKTLHISTKSSIFAGVNLCILTSTTQHQKTIRPL